MLLAVVPTSRADPLRSGTGSHAGPVTTSCRTPVTRFEMSALGARHHSFVKTVCLERKTQECLHFRRKDPRNNSRLIFSPLKKMAVLQ